MAILVASVSASELKDKALTETKDANNSLSRSSRHVDIDPHDTLCWDVSIYLDVTFDQEPCEKCMPRLDTVRKPSSTQVCETPTEYIEKYFVTFVYQILLWRLLEELNGKLH